MVSCDPAGDVRASSGASPDVVSVLRLLADEASLQDIQDLGQSVAAGLDDAGAEGWREALGLVTRLWWTLSDRKRREHEMVALFETARDLTSLLDTDQVLDGIVQRARQLFATDTCYLALLYPDTGEARMRVTAGSVGSSITQTRLPWGSGLVGVMQESGRPCCSSDYVNDPKVRHDPSVDAAALDEGIVSIAGAPLKSGNQMTGALFLASRRERFFTDAELNLLGSLADHAAIVLENARLFDAMRSTLGELRQANREIDVHSKALERAGVAHEQLMRLVLNGSDLDALAHGVSGMLDADLLLLDATLQVRARAGSASPASVEALAEQGFPVQRLLEQSTASGTSRATEVPRDPGARPEARVQEVWVAPVQAGAEVLGSMVLSTGNGLSRADVRTFERSAQTAALMLLMERTMALAEDQVRGELVDDLFGERVPDWGSVGRRAKHLGLDLRRPHVVLVASAEGASRRSLLSAATAFLRERAGVAGELAGQVVLVVRDGDPGGCARAASMDLGRRARAPVTVGAAGPVTSLQGARASYREAERCLRLLLALGRQGEGAGFEELGVFGALLEATSEDRLKTFVSQSLGLLQEYDARQGTQLVATLEAFYAAGGIPRVTAERIHVHPNTVYQRLDRVDHVIGSSAWRTPDGALEMQLALKLRRILATSADLDH